MTRFFFIFLVVFAISSATGAQTTQIVTSTSDAGTGSLRQAIFDATPGDTIVFDESLLQQTILLTTGPLSIDKELTIQGPGVSLRGSPLFLELTANDVSRVLEVQPGVAVRMSNLIISGGFSETDGGGLWIGEEARVTLEYLTFSDNLALDNGGAIFNGGGAETVTRSLIIENNKAVGDLSPNGGGVYNASGYILLEGAVISGNESVRGGGVWNTGNGVVELFGTLVQDNKAELEGGGVYNNHKMIIHSSTIAENRAEEEAGGVRNRSSDSLLIVNSTISSNEAKQTGGIYNFRGSKVYIYNSTIVANESEEEGAGILNEEDGTISLYSSILAANRRAGSVPSDVVDQSGGGVFSEGFNIIGARASMNVVSTDQSGTSSSPFNPQLDTLAKNGSSSLVHMPRSISLAIDRGECQRMPLSLDQNGFLRIIDIRGVDNASDGCDVGSVEYMSAINVANEEFDELPEIKMLTSAYPNPFSSEATFSVEVEKNQHVAIALFDLLGRRVQVIFVGFIQGGTTHLFRINMDNSLPSGVYMYQVQGESVSESKKVLYVR